MKKLTQTLTIALLVGTASGEASSYIEDYAITKEYKLLNDMRVARKQQELILKMGRELDARDVDVESLKALEGRFTQVLNGLIYGDDSLELRGTKLPAFRSKLVELKRVWGEESKLMRDSISNIDLRDEAKAKLNGLMIKMSELIELYNQSYSRFKQKSKISSIVYRHTLNSEKRHIASIL
ncbi:MAG: hypothetical protein GXO06_00610 [Epsilonproteobacteria bacterium]|nr:hypothetical protein [Campylobacterota bacterium]